MADTRFLGALVLMLAVVLAPHSSLAEEENRAGLAVVLGDGRTLTRCVSFREESLSGVELLTRSGLEVILDTSSGLGVTVCRIEGTGCTYPEERCFCQCMGGGECRYWNYFFREAGQVEWTYSALGPLLRKVRPGSVEAWVWGDGRTPPSEEVTFEAICASATPPAASTARPTASPTAAAATAVATASSVQTRAAQPSGSPAAAFYPTPTAVPASLPSLGPYWPFGLLILVLIGLGAYLRFLRK